ncbi:MAG: serine hydroxymethyltransferase, partial [Proteobacteria bacterium]|nr:serine hydroxymethyltransferase [Pseudomonadota bacterium]
MAQTPWYPVKSVDPEIYQLIELELARQRSTLEMIASENFLHPALMAGMASPFTNKYAEGLPHRRYYDGCVHVDAMEELAIKRVTELFGCEFANVQPHSGASANAAVMMSLLEPGDRVLGLDLDHGGHLTHGSPVNFSGRLYDAHFYQLDNNKELLDYHAIEAKALEIKPAMIVAGASAYPRIIDFAAFRTIADKVGAYLLVDMAHIAGLVASHHHPSPFPHAHVVTSTTHKTLRGPRGGVILWNDDQLSTLLNKGVFPILQGGPLLHQIAMKGSCFLLAASDEFKVLQQKTIDNAQAFAQTLVSQGQKLVSGGTDNHLVLLDVRHRDFDGATVASVLDHLGITVNKNAVPGDP